MAFNYKTELDRYRKYYQSLTPVFTKPKPRAYTAVVFSFLAVSLFGWYAIRPTVQTILYLQRETKDKIILNQKMEEKIFALVEAQVAYREVEPYLGVVSQSLPQSPDALGLVLQLRNLARVAGVTLMGVQMPQVPITGEATPSAQKSATQKLADFSTTITVTGPYSAIKSFLEGLHTMRRIVWVEGMGINPIRQESVGTPSATIQSPGSTSVQLVLKLKAHYLTQ